MDQNGSEWTRMDQNGQEWTRMDKNGQEWTRMDQNGPEWTNLITLLTTLDQKKGRKPKRNRGRRMKKKSDAALLPFSTFYADSR